MTNLFIQRSTFLYPFGFTAYGESGIVQNTSNLDAMVAYIKKEVKEGRIVNVNLAKDIGEYAANALSQATKEA